MHYRPVDIYAYLELNHILSDCFNNTSDVVALVDANLCFRHKGAIVVIGVLGRVLRDFPIFGVGARDDDLDQDLLAVRRRNVACCELSLDRRTGLVNDLLHCLRHDEKTLTCRGD
jgi:hypothetical protein